MNDTPEKRDGVEHVETAGTSRIESIGRVLFLFGGGLLLSVLVSCACGPTR